MKLVHVIRLSDTGVHVEHGPGSMFRTKFTSSLTADGLTWQVCLILLPATFLIHLRSKHTQWCVVPLQTTVDLYTKRISLHSYQLHILLDFQW